MALNTGSAVLSADAYAAMIEQVMPEVPRLFDQTDRLSKLIGKGKSITISDRFARGPMLKYIGGTFQMFNPDNGVVGSGSGLNSISFQVGYYYTNYAVALSFRAKDTTATGGQSRIEVFATQQAEAMQELAVYEDITLHGDGTGLLTNASSAVASPGTGDTLTFAGANDTLGINMLREGMAVNVCAIGTGSIGSVPNNVGTADAGGVVRANATKAGYPAIITGIDYDARKVSLDSVITGLTTGDRLQVVGLLLTPAVTGQAGYPSTSFTSGTDSFRHGIPYANQIDTTLYYNGLNRAVQPQINPTAYNLSGAPQTANHILIIRDRMTQRRDASVLKGLFGISHMAQRANAMNIGISVSEWQRHAGANEPLLDLMPANIDYEESYVVGGMVHYLSKRQPRDRTDYFNPKLWGRAEVFAGPRPMSWGGQTVWPTLSSTAQLQAGLQMFWEQAFDWYCQDPGAQMVLYNAAVPQGYTPGT